MRVEERAVGVMGIVAVPVAAVAISSAFFRRLLSGSRVYVALDFVTIHMPFRRFISRAVASHQLPLWTPDLFMGIPFLANGDTGLFYPFQAAFFMMDPGRAIGITLWFHVILTLLTSYALFRISLRASPPAALTAATVFTLNGYALSHTGFLNFIYIAPWVPLLFLACERCVERDLRWTLVGALAVGLTLLTGQPQEMAWCAPFLPLFLVIVVLRDPTRRRAIRAAAGLVVSFVAGAALAAVQVLPQNQLISRTNRGAGYSFTDSSFGQLPTKLAAKILLPDYGKTFYGENAGWIGVVAIALVVCGIVFLVRRHRWWELGLWSGMSVLSFLLALGPQTPLYRWWYTVVPFADHFRFPVRFLYPMTLALGALVAYGTDEALGRVRTLRSPRVVLATGGAVVLAVLVVAFSGWGAHLVGAWDQHREFVTASVLAGVLGLAGVLAARLGALPVKVAGALIVLAVFVELFGVNQAMEWNHPGDPSVYRTVRTLPAYVAAHGGGRVLPAAPTPPGDFVDAPARIEGNTALLADLSSVSGFGGSLSLRQYLPLAEQFLGPLTTDDVTAVNKVALMQELGVQWIVGSTTQPNLAASPALNIVATDNDRVLYALKQPGARVRTFCGAGFDPDPQHVAATVLDPAFTTDDLIIAGREPSTPSHECGHAEVVKSADNAVTVVADVPHDGWLLLADTWFPGWEASVDQQPVAIRQANAFFRAVPLRAGAHRVVFEYVPKPVRAGFAISIVAWLLWFGAAVVIGVRLALPTWRRVRARLTSQPRP